MLPQIQSYDSNLLFSKHNSQNDLMKNQNTLINDEDNSSQRKSILKKKNTLSSLSIGTYVRVPIRISIHRRRSTRCMIR